MRRRALLRQRAWGEAILERLHAADVPKALARHVRVFKAAHVALVAATKLAIAARERRDSALSAVARADGSLERAVLSLGKRLVAARLGTKDDPFAGRSALTPDQIVTLEPARGAAEILRVASTVRHADAPSAVKKAANACTEAARAIARATARVAKEQATYARAVGARDARLVAWTTSLARLKRGAEHAWQDRPNDVARVFAPPEGAANAAERTAFFEHRPVLPKVMNGVSAS